MWNFLVCVTVILGNGALSEVTDDEQTPLLLPKTSFSCQNRPPGYYADLETACRTYHVCDGNSHFTYACPSRTLFQQRSRICDHSYLVRCEDSPNFFDEIYPEDEHEILLRLVESEEQTQTENVDEFSTLTTVFFTTDTTQPIKPSDAPVTPTTPVHREAPPPTQPPPPPIPPNKPQTNPNLHSQDPRGQNKTLRFVIKDFRSLFYIPEVENNAITAQAQREFALPVDRKNVMKFRNGKKARHAFSACPGYCDPKFFLPGTCHPCIMIK